MATKANLISAVNGFLTAIITQLKVRNAQLEVINELYPSAVTDDSISETYTTQNTPTVTYAIQMTKQGRSNFITISYTNTSNVSLPANTEIFAFKTNEFRGSTSEFIGENVIYTPFKISSRNSIPPLTTVKSTIRINVND
jgi:hypothetical protein